MKKKLVISVFATMIVLTITACNKGVREESSIPANEPVILTSEPTAVVTSEPEETDTAASGTLTSESTVVTEESGRENGERFEATIMLEGMEETVHYEHVKNEEIGYEMDYDYEFLIRTTGEKSDFYGSVYDDAGNPMNYMKIEYTNETVESMIESFKSEFEKYEFEVQDYTLENAGACKRIPAEVLKGTNNMADELQMIYIIPAGSGCIVVREHYAIEAAEGFGSRFKQMLNTLKVIK
jgi:hypothetical protein